MNPNIERWLLVGWMGMLMVCFMRPVQAQTLERSVITPYGGEFMSAGGSLSQTLGEVATETLESPKYHLTQGFEQPEISATSVGHDFSSHIQVYPVPTTGKLKIDQDQLIFRKAQLFDKSGRLVKSFSLENLAYDCDLSELAAATYTLRLFDSNLYPAGMAVYHIVKIQ
ncbi:hypothetical protein [Pontibacter sp. G13]|uniref:hypothetical protein n=1 Tax=Pontibacter sp. G13 TaxID=3074898 RepID=UPI002889F11A|nr:hypothetical protein [Pontibacter sp. G13]WNJ18704.1 hypothetical protein RJD25_27935 [Pontibacter sp. G13]